jgi:CheY-like chemotaxis protein/HPt (histidine-containing phosphotransfer) domain-containing protein
MAGGDQLGSDALTVEGFDQPEGGGRHILLAEDSVVNQKLAVGLLARRGHSVVVAKNGVEALEMFGREPFDVILMDVQMPDMDGLEATAAIRQKEAISGHHVPIIAMTAHAMRGDRERCLAAGMDDYLAKPIRAEGLFAAIESAVGSRDGAVRGSAAKDDAAAKQAVANETGAAATVVDWAEALDRVGEDEELLRDVVDAFLQESPTLLAELRRAVDSGDTKLMRRAAHTLKTSFGHFGATEAAELSEEIETLATDGRTDGVRALCDRLHEPARAVLAVLGRYYAEGEKM